jgi:DNA-binding MarR family transcriptional regulator
MPTRQPIGYWLKLLDRLIEENFDRVLGAQGLTRRHWQVLNSIASGPMDQGQLDRALAPFADSPSWTSTPIVDDLRTRDWLETSGDGLTLTTVGQAAMVELRTSVAATRARVSDGITEAQYAATIETLARMCANLQPSVG